MSQLECNICGLNTNHKEFEVREMMLGLKEIFHYIECVQCGCLQQVNPPEDMSRYYPKSYYSFKLKNKPGRIRLKIKNLKNEYATTGSGFIGKLLFKTRPNPILKILSKLPLNKEQYILDVGCGSGLILYDLKDLGYKNLLGIDPFIDQTFTYDNGLKIEKKDLTQLVEKEKWDLIMFHHSFEHLPDPGRILKHASQLLKKGGTCLIRVPVADSFAYKKYKKDWAQIDAPRHYHVFTNKGMEYLAQGAGMVLTNKSCDSNAFQFWGSEQYIKDIPLHDQHSYAVDPSSSIFTGAVIKLYEKEAVQLNKKGEGDSRAFFLKKN